MIARQCLSILNERMSETKNRFIITAGVFAHKHTHAKSEREGQPKTKQLGNGFDRQNRKMVRAKKAVAATT